MISAQNPWTLAQRVSHWIALVATIATAVLALVLVYPPEWSDHYSQRYTAGIEVHKLLGVVAGLAAVSLILAHGHRPTREGSPFQRRAASVAQWALLVLTPMVAILGYIASSFYGGLLRIPLVGNLPSPFPYNESWGAPLTLADDWLAYLLIGAVFLHGLAAILHLTKGAAYVVTRMLFGMERKP
jgi:cytochrome b561